MYSSGYGAGVDDLRAPGPSRPGGGGVDDVAKRVKDPLLKAADWVKTRSPKEKSILAGAAAVFVRCGREGEGRRAARAALQQVQGCCARTRAHEARLLSFFSMAGEERSFRPLTHARVGARFRTPHPRLAVRAPVRTRRAPEE
jgi:hypothetical protein